MIRINLRGERGRHEILSCMRVMLALEGVPFTEIWPEFTSTSLGRSCCYQELHLRLDLADLTVQPPLDKLPILQAE
jgi:hypothetical protein